LEISADLLAAAARQGRQSLPPLGRRHVQVSATAGDAMPLGRRHVLGPISPANDSSGSDDGHAHDASSSLRPPHLAALDEDAARCRAS
jgi:hypothetical protein